MALPLGRRVGTAHQKLSIIAHQSLQQYPWWAVPTLQYFLKFYSLVRLNSSVNQIKFKGVL